MVKVVTPRAGKRRGAKPGERRGGRQKGTKNKATLRLAEVLAAASAAMAIGGVIDAHVLLMAVYKNTTLDIELRLDAAKMAIRYETPVPSAVVANQDIPADLAEDDAPPDEPGPTNPVR